MWISYKGVGRIKGTMPKDGEAPPASNCEEPSPSLGLQELREGGFTSP